MTTTLDRRYGTFRYGTQKYGPSDPYEAIAWGIEIDWRALGYFDGTNEASRMITAPTVNRGRTNYLRPDGKGFESVRTGTASITLTNQDGRYDAWNTASPLYPNVEPGKDIRIRVLDRNTGVIEYVFSGVIQNIQPMNDFNGDAYVVITASDGWDYLRNNDAGYTTQQNITPGAAIGFTLDSVGWPSTWGRDIDAGSDNIRYWWANGNQTAGKVIEDLANSFVGFFFINAQGQAVYRTRSNVGAPVVELTQDVLLNNPSLPQPWLNSRNTTRIKTHPRTAATSGVIYQLIGDAPSIQNGETFSYFGDYTYNGRQVPATNIQTPTATTDYTMNTAANGSGTDKTSQCTVSLTDFGDRGKFDITNNSGGLVYLTKNNLRGQALYEPNVSDVVYPATVPARPRNFILDLLWQQDVNVAKDFSNVIGPFLAGKHPYPVVSIEARPGLQFAPDLFDIVILSLPKYGIVNESFRVGGITHRPTGETAQAVTTTFYLESYVSADGFWTWDTSSVFGTSTIFGA